jgi:hypothetical protein
MLSRESLFFSEEMMENKYPCADDCETGNDNPFDTVILDDDMDDFILWCDATIKEWGDK